MMIEKLATRERAHKFLSAFDLDSSEGRRGLIKSAGRAGAAAVTTAVAFELANRLTQPDDTGNRKSHPLMRAVIASVVTTAGNYAADGFRTPLPSPDAAEVADNVVAAIEAGGLAAVEADLVTEQDTGTV